MSEHRWLAMQSTALQWGMRPLREELRDWLESMYGTRGYAPVNVLGGARGAASEDDIGAIREIF